MFFPRQGFGNPFSQFVGNPYLSAAMPPGIQFQSGLGFQGINPLTGFTLSTPFPGAVPSFTPIGYPAINPFLVPHQAFQSLGAYGSQQGLGQPLQPSVPGGVGQFEGQQGGIGNPQQWGNPFVAGAPGFAGGLTNPGMLGVASINPTIGDPFAGVVPLNPGFYQQFPVRPLISPQHINPLQQGIPIGALAGQTIDPYSAILQAQLISQLAANPYHQFRGYGSAPWLGQGGQLSPYAQTGACF